MDTQNGNYMPAVKWAGGDVPAPEPGRIAALHRMNLLDAPSEEAFDRACRLSTTALRAPVGLLALTDGEREFFKSCVGLPESPCTTYPGPLSPLLAAGPLASREALIIPDVRKQHPDQLVLPIMDPRLVSYLGVPLITSDNYVTGFLSIADTTPREWSGTDVAVLTDIAKFVITEMELRCETILDSLTGVFNRRYMEESLQREVHRAGRRQSKVGVIMLDLDRFKRVNEKLGHAAGDAFLRAMGNFLQQCTRGEDVACRYGGEEFTVIMPDAGIADTSKRAEQLRTAARQLRVDFSGKRLGPITLSAGVAAMPMHGSSADQLLQIADAALYRAKRSGRNRVEVGMA